MTDREHDARAQAIVAALLADRARLHHVVAQLQLMAAEKYKDTAAWRFKAQHWARSRGAEEIVIDSTVECELAQRDAAALSKLARQAAGVEE